MNKTFVLIEAQFYENYNIDGSEPYWKPKGGIEFKVEVTMDNLMYSEDKCIIAFKKILDIGTKPGNKCISG